MTEKPPMRLKFKDSSSSSPPVKAAPPPPAKVGSEEVVVKCGHTIVFDLYAKDPFRDQRRVKAVSRECQACRQVRVATDVAAAKERKAKKASFAKALKPRLPDGARFAATYDATAVQWTGTLIVEGATFERRASSLNKLLYKLDDVYRASLPAAVASSQDPVASP